MSTAQPKIGIGAVVFHRDKVLLVQRKNPPAAGQWAIPGGKIKLGESLQQAAEREIMEETGIRIHAREPIYAFDLIQHNAQGDCETHYVVVDVEADYITGQAQAADDAADVRWVSAEELDTLPVNSTTRHLLQSRYNFG